VADVVPGGGLGRREADDFPARIHVNFRVREGEVGLLDRLRRRLARMRYGAEPPGSVLVYVWGNEAPAGTMAPSPYADEVRLVVVRSGRGEVGRWWEEERDLVEDYRAAFGADPPEIMGFAVMTDSDDTGTRARACYGDIVLLGPEGAAAPPGSATDGVRRSPPPRGTPGSPG